MSCSKIVVYMGNDLHHCWVSGSQDFSALGPGSVDSAATPPPMPLQHSQGLQLQFLAYRVYRVHPTLYICPRQKRAEMQWNTVRDGKLTLWVHPGRPLSLVFLATSA